MATQLTPEQRAKRIKSRTELAIFILFGLIAAPFVATAIYGIMGIIAAALIGTTALTLGPWVGMRLANWKMALIKAEASRSPVETMQNELLRRRQLLEEKKGSIELFLGKVQSLERQVQVVHRDYPEDAPRFDDILAKMKQLAQIRKDNWRQASASTDEYEQTIKKAKILWETSRAASETAEAGGMSNEEFWGKLKSETALDSINDSMDHAFAQLETSLMDQDAALPKGQTAKLLNQAAQDAQPVQFRLTIKQPEPATR